VKRHRVDVAVVADEHAEIGDLICRPEARGAVVGAGEEVVAVGSPCDVPDSVVVALVDDEAGPGFEGPEADGFVGGAGEEVLGRSRGGGGGGV